MQGLVLFFVITPIYFCDFTDFIYCDFTDFIYCDYTDWELAALIFLDAKQNIRNLKCRFVYGSGNIGEIIP